MRSFTGHSDWIFCLQVSGGIIASGSSGKMIIHKVEDGYIVKEISAHLNWIDTVAFNKDGTMLASGSDDCTCKVWDTESWEELKEIRHPNIVKKVGFTEDNILVTGCSDNVIRMFDACFNEIVVQGV